ncbi:MAG: YibE/F family protein [Fretibacterium sp.]|nr:YibE/F family protein [Fretibacterium sp.]
MRGFSLIGKQVLLRLLAALLFSWAVYGAVNFWTLRHWDSGESLVVHLLAAGAERKVPSSSGEDTAEEETFQMLERPLTVRLLTGAQKGETHDLLVTRLAGTGVDPTPGGRYLLVQDSFEDGARQYSIADAFRLPAVAGIVSFTSSLLLVFAGWSGFRALLGLGISILCLLWGVVPLIVAGWSPIPLGFAAALITSVATVACVVRRSRYRTVALLGSLGGVTGGFLWGVVMVFMWKLTGLAGESAALLASTLPGIDIRGVLLASVIIGAIGAVLDVGISITASMAELVDYDPDIPLRRLWYAGMHVGGEMLGSMINTLILAYIGSSMATVLLITNAGAEIRGLFNDPYIAEELVQSLAGTVGLLLTIPFTASFFVLQERYSRQSETEKQDGKAT